MVVVSPRQQRNLLQLPLYGGGNSNNDRSPSPVLSRRTSKGNVNAFHLLQIMIGSIVILLGVNFFLSSTTTTTTNNKASTPPLVSTVSFVVENNKASSASLVSSLASSSSSASSVVVVDENSSEQEEGIHHHPSSSSNNNNNIRVPVVKQPSTSLYRVRKDYLQHLERLSSIPLSSSPTSTSRSSGIPKIVHVIFPNATKLPSDVNNYKLLQHNIIGSMMLGKGSSSSSSNSKKQPPLNSNWELRLYDDDAIHNIIKDAALVDGLISKREYYDQLQHVGHIKELVDIAKYVLLYKFGGLYINVDRIVNVQLDSVLDSLDDDNNKYHHEVPAKLFIPTTSTNFDYGNNNNVFANDMIASVAKNDLFKIMLETMSDERLHGNRFGRGSILLNNDSKLLTEVISEVVFEKNGYRNSGDDDTNINVVYEASDLLLLQSNGIIRSGQQESLYCIGPLVTTKDFDDGDGLCDDQHHLDDKTDLYQAYGLAV